MMGPTAWSASSLGKGCAHYITAGLLFLSASKSMYYVGEDEEAFVNEARLLVILIISQPLAAR